MTGYVVTTDVGIEVLYFGDGLHDDYPKKGVLLSHPVGTLFRKRKKAVKAIERTLQYAKEKGLQWADFHFCVEKVRG